MRLWKRVIDGLSVGCLASCPAAPECSFRASRPLTHRRGGIGHLPHLPHLPQGVEVEVQYHDVAEAGKCPVALYRIRPQGVIPVTQTEVGTGLWWVSKLRPQWGWDGAWERSGRPERTEWTGPAGEPVRGGQCLLAVGTRPRRQPASPCALLVAGVALSTL